MTVWVGDLGEILRSYNVEVEDQTLDHDGLTVTCQLPSLATLQTQYQRGWIARWHIEHVAEIYFYAARYGTRNVEVRAESLKITEFLDSLDAEFISTAAPRSIDLLLCEGPALSRALEVWHMERSERSLLTFTTGSDLMERMQRVSPTACNCVRLAFIDTIVGDRTPGEGAVRFLVEGGVRVIAISNCDAWNKRLLAAGANEAIPSAKLLAAGALPLEVDTEG